MGLFTGTPSASPRSTSSAPLKRRSLGRNKEKIIAAAAEKAKTTTNPVVSSGASAAALSNPLSNGAIERIHSEPAQAASSSSDTSGTAHIASSSKSQPIATKAVPQAAPSSDTEPDLELDDLQSDNAFLYDRQVSLDSALGLAPLAPPAPSLLERIDAYIQEHYLDCFGITHHNELVHHHNRLIPFVAKAPRFLSIHSLKRKELERDYTDVPDTSETCPRKESCLGRCLLGFECPPQDPSSILDSVGS